MLDNLYKDIGDKIKSLAKWTFVIEAIGAIITGISLMATDDDLVFIGFLTFICGPVVALVSTWILYAFGEMVDKVCANENSTRKILMKLNEKPIETKSTSVQPKATPQNKYAHAWRCDRCGKMRTQNPCEHCGGEGNEPRQDTASFSIIENGNIVCSQCNFEQPNNRSICWHCGAKFKQS